MAGDLDRVLDRLGEHHGLAHRVDDRARRLEPRKDCGNRAFGIDDDMLALQRREIARKGGTVMHAHRIAEMLGDIVGHFFGRDVEIGGAVRVDHRIGERDGGALNVLAADVEGPCDRIERRQHDRIGILLLQPIGNLLALVVRVAPGQFLRMDDELGLARLGLVGPDLVDGVGVHRHQLSTAFGQRLFRLFDPGLGVQPGIIADPPALGRVLAQPFGDAGLRDALILPEIAVDLIAHLQRVAAIDEDRRILGQDRGRPRRPFKAGEPGKTLRIGADIFAHMLVADRHDEAVEAIGFQLFAQRLEACFMGGHWVFLDF